MTSSPTDYKRQEGLPEVHSTACGDYKKKQTHSSAKKDASLLVGLNKRDSLIGTQAGSANTFLSAEKERAHARERLKKKIDSASKSRNRSSTNASDASSSAGRGKGSRGTGSSA
ncbi:hypothetical protein BSLG_000982 [Batrachochytrium salamandrivorans]|nr:hypothetical protein BSLG_009429 [Batrachochytrium salamandrivorans]KAJ1344422.1 hypothetical protein BSLG_000982 [Batrachochytrium salamandrivorans]